MKLFLRLLKISTVTVMPILAIVGAITAIQTYKQQRIYNNIVNNNLKMQETFNKVFYT